MTDDQTPGIDTGPITPGTIVKPPPPEPRQPQLALAVVVALILLLLAGVVGWFLWSLADRAATLQERVETQNATISHLTDELVASNDNAKTLYDQLLKLGETPEGQKPSEATSTPGPAGAQGVPGPEGPQGEPGPQGKQGVAGKTGDQGIQGLPGLTGATGAAGPAGATGDPGPQGVQGEPGAAGPAGPAGPQGAPGPICPTGYEPQVFWVKVSPDQTGPQQDTQAALCVPDAPQG